MITPKIKALFQFIEYLHSNIDNFNLNNELIQKLELLKDEQDKLKPKKSFKDKLKFDELQNEIENKFKILQDNTAKPLKAKAKELNLCNFNNEPIYFFNDIEKEIYLFKENFIKDDLPEIFKRKQQYIEYRQQTHKTFLSLAFFIDELDEITKSLFDFFKETDQKEFETFEKKIIEVDSIEEAIQVFTNKKHKDIRFWLTTFFEKQEQTKHEYKSYKREIENNGCFILKTETDIVKIYTPELTVILTSKELPARNMETQTETTINGWDYLSTYIEAYKEGEKYFEAEFKVSPNILYGENAEHYIRDIHFNFFHVQHIGTNEGWVYVKKQYPIILTQKAVKEFGYYSGIVSKIEVQISKYPKLFATFDICEHNVQPQQPENNKNIDNIKELHTHIFKGNAFELFEKYHSKMSLQQNSRTDLNLLFQLLKNDGLFVETVELKHYIKWLNETYGYDLTELKKVDINSKPNIQRTNVYKEYKQTTLK
jgi:hypothetical protein